MINFVKLHHMTHKEFYNNFHMESREWTAVRLNATHGDSNVYWMTGAKCSSVDINFQAIKTINTFAERN